MISLISSLPLFAAVVLAAANFEGNIAAGLKVGSWQYLGCADEIPGRALQGLSYSDDWMTIENCQSFCLKNNFPLSGVEYGRECYCGKTLAKPSELGKPGCDMACHGNGRQQCGGVARVAVFNATDFSPPAPPRLAAGGWQYQSCYMEPMGVRALATLVRADDRMTVEMCTQTCADNMYAYAGLEYGRECWCGAQPAPDLEDASDPSCAMQCDIPCGGNSRQICGGRGAITLYHNGGPGKREIHAQGELHIDAMRARKGRFFKEKESRVAVRQQLRRVPGDPAARATPPRSPTEHTNISDAGGGAFLFRLRGKYLLPLAPRSCTPRTQPSRYKAGSNVSHARDAGGRQESFPTKGDWTDATDEITGQTVATIAGIRERC
ncbi:WSC domain-containing protein [Xylariaceae sp. FL0662B]|nr:WSC domain-containing protein [Xylariaceae sp. FL0662B]